MSEPLVQSCRVVSHESRGRAIYELTVDAPEIAAQVEPGQFVHLALLEQEAHLLRRPLSVFDANETEGTLCLLYQVVGEGTAHLSQVSRGTCLSLLGPVGRGWQPPAHTRHALLVGGGVGWAPLSMLCKRLRERGVVTHVLVGAQSAEALEAVYVAKPWAAHPVDGSEHCTHDTLTTQAKLRSSDNLHEYFCTDDGSVGHHGFTTDLVPELLRSHPFDYLATCGPEPMQKKVAHLAAEAGIFSEVSLERRMACGIGACLSCAVDTVAGKQRACVDGPVFNGQEVCW